jgi:hypothetical protein
MARNAGGRSRRHSSPWWWRRRPRKSKPSTSETMSMDAIGMYTRTFSRSMRMSPGKWPNHPSAPVHMSRPTSTSTMPIAMTAGPNDEEGGTISLAQPSGWIVPSYSMSDGRRPGSTVGGRRYVHFQGAVNMAPLGPSTAHHRLDRNIIVGACLLIAGAWAPLPAQATDQAAGAPIASPRDTARGTVGGAHLLVDYGRPSKRGRVIFGGLVPWGEVWRTGANAATTLVTDKDLVIGGTPVAAGTYTLYTVPNKTGDWKLVISKQTGQWGTEYHEDRDLARVPLTVGSVAPPLERFTITVAPAGAGGTIQLAWDTTRAQVPFTVR